MKFRALSILSLATSLVAGQSFCSNSSHSGQSVKITSNKVGTIGDVGYELWADSGNNSATFYSDGSFSCSFNNAKDYLCRTGLSFDSTKTHDQIGHMYADFKLVKQNIRNVDYSYVGIYGWSRNPLVEYYIVDNWLSQWRPGDWVGNKKHGDFMIDGAMYTVYENTRNGPSIDGNTTFKQFFSIRQTARDCGTIDITAHFQQWEKLGMKLGKMHEAKVLGEAGSTSSGTSGTADFPYAKVYIGNGGGNQNTAAKTVPRTSNAKTIPKTTSAGVKTIPKSSSGKTIPTTAGKTIPVSSSGKTIPKSSSGKTIPVTSAGKTIPVSSSGKTIPKSSSGKTITVTSSCKTITVSSGKTIPVSSGKTIPSSGVKTIPNQQTSCKAVTVTVNKTVTVTVTEKQQQPTNNNQGGWNQGGNNGNCAAKWGQCGGNGFSGPTCCQQGSSCQFVNEWYSQCL